MVPHGADTPSYNETDLISGGCGISLNSRAAGDTRSELGARYDNQIWLDPYRVLAFRAPLAWAHDWISDPTLAAVFQTLPGASFIVNDVTPAKNSALTSAGAELRIASSLSFLANFDANSGVTPPPTPGQAPCDIRGDARRFELSFCCAALTSLLAQSRHADRRTKCPLLGEERTPCFMGTRPSRD
jgi:Autotransporter beta-domain